MKVVGQEITRVDAFGKVTGEAKYTADLEPRDILHGKVVHSTIANGLVKSFDLDEALKVPGVVKIVTCFDVPDIQFPTAGHPWSVELKHQDICDRKILNQRVRLYGDDIAAVVAENEVAAAQAARLIKVEYEEYEPIVTVEAALKPEATPLHPDLRKDNVVVHSHMTMDLLILPLKREERKPLKSTERKIWWRLMKHMILQGFPTAILSFPFPGPMWIQTEK